VDEFGSHAAAGGNVKGRVWFEHDAATRGKDVRGQLLKACTGCREGRALVPVRGPVRAHDCRMRLRGLLRSLNRRENFYHSHHQRIFLPAGFSIECADRPTRNVFFFFNLSVFIKE